MTITVAVLAALLAAVNGGNDVAKGVATLAGSGISRLVDPKLDALLAVARQAAGNVGTIDDQTWQEALAAGWSDTQLAELFVHVAVNLFTNYFNHYNRTEFDLPPAP